MHVGFSGGDTAGIVYVVRVVGGNAEVVVLLMVHIFTGEARRFYELDRLFPDAEKINAD